MEQEDYINARIRGEVVDTPRFLYKYRPFDAHTYDMLEKGYVFLCPADKLDDPSECDVDFSIDDLYDMGSDRIKFKCIERILEDIRPYTSEEIYQLARSTIFRCVTPNGLVQRNFLLDNILDIQEGMPDVDFAPIVNFLANIPNKLDEPQTKEYFEKLLSLAHSAKKKMGICSLSEIKNLQDMWSNYADQSRGYCIEYDMQEYRDLGLLYPVKYQDGRENNIVTCIVGTFVGQMIHFISNGQAQSDASQYMRLFLTKDTKWDYQKEWRLLGDAAEKLPAPPIHAIYLGKNMPEQDKRQMMDYCELYNIAIK